MVAKHAAGVAETGVAVAVAPSPAVPYEVLDVSSAFRQHFRFVWGTMTALGVPQSGVDDAVQDVFVVAHRRRRDYDGRASVRAWLYGIARGVARNHRRRGRNRKEIGAGSGAQEAAAAPGPVPEDRLDQRETVAHVETILAGLDPKQREVFVLTHVEGMTAPEIAALLGIKLNTVYSRLRLARRRFERDLASAQGRDEEN